MLRIAVLVEHLPPEFMVAPVLHIVREAVSMHLSFIEVSTLNSCWAFNATVRMRSTYREVIQRFSERPKTKRIIIADTRCARSGPLYAALGKDGEGGGAETEERRGSEEDVD